MQTRKHGPDPTDAVAFPRQSSTPSVANAAAIVRRARTVNVRSIRPAAATPWAGVCPAAKRGDPFCSDRYVLRPADIKGWYTAYAPPPAGHRLLAQPQNPPGRFLSTVEISPRQGLAGQGGSALVPAVTKAISSPRSLVPTMRNPYAAKNEAALANRSSRRRGEAPGALTHMVAANLRARALAPVIQELRAAGFVSYGSVARELNQRRVPPLRGGQRWYPMTVSRVLVRLAKQRL
jgi:hypothetical protein